jgi:hypothetical protein
MAYSAFDQFQVVFPMTSLTEGMGGVFKGRDFFWQSGFAVVAGFTFFDFLAIEVRKPFAFHAFAVVAGFALQSDLVRGMGEIRRFRGLCRIKGRLKGYFLRTPISTCCLAQGKGDTAKRHENAANQRFFHDKASLIQNSFQTFTKTMNTMGNL